jgi:hypothetical protein
MTNSSDPMSHVNDTRSHGRLISCWGVQAWPGHITLLTTISMISRRLLTISVPPLQRYRVRDDMVKNLLAGNSCVFVQHYEHYTFC